MALLGQKTKHQPAITRKKLDLGKIEIAVAKALAEKVEVGPMIGGKVETIDGKVAMTGGKTTTVENKAVIDVRTTAEGETDAINIASLASRSPLPKDSTGGSCRSKKA